MEILGLYFESIQTEKEGLWLSELCTDNDAIFLIKTVMLILKV